MDEEHFHQAWLVRIWAVHRNGELLWRASAEDAHTGERLVFADLASLCSFLCGVADVQGAPDAVAAQGNQETQ